MKMEFRPMIFVILLTVHLSSSEEVSLTSAIQLLTNSITGLTQALSTGGGSGQGTTSQKSKCFHVARVPHGAFQCNVTSVRRMCRHHGYKGKVRLATRKEINLVRKYSELGLRMEYVLHNEACKTGETTGFKVALCKKKAFCNSQDGAVRYRLKRSKRSFASVLT